LKHFNSSLATEDLQLQERSFYNLGNAHYRIGEEEKEPPQKQANWEQAVTSYESALKLNPNDADAKYNLDLVKKKQKALKQQQQQAQQKPGNDNKQDEQEADQPGHQLKTIQMTPQQAVRLLESAKQEERTLVFIPPNKTNRNDRLLKDW